MKPIKRIMKLYLPSLPDWRKEGEGNCALCYAYGQLYNYYYKRGKKGTLWKDGYFYCKICVTKRERPSTYPHGNAGVFKYLASVRR